MGVCSLHIKVLSSYVYPWPYFTHKLLLHKNPIIKTHIKISKETLVSSDSVCLAINCCLDCVDDEYAVYRTDVNPLVDVTELSLADTPSQLDSVPLDLIVLSYG